MTNYILSRIWWFGWRVVVTAMCIVTVQNIIHLSEGYLIPFNVLAAGAVALIVGVRVWMPSPIQK